MAQRSNDDRLLAEIPWIERPIGDKRLEDTNFYKGIGEKCPLEEKIRRLQLFWMLNETFPFYLPQRYHAMDCLALHKNSKDGNYWANASVFLFNTTAYGHRFLAKLNDFLKVGEPDLKTLSKSTSLYKTIKQKYLKGNLEECKSAAEFLLDPWVLLQLPLQPMLLYQWLIALLAEAYKFEKEIHEIVQMMCLRQLNIPVKKLIEILLKMIQFAENQLALIYGYAKTGQGNSFHSYLHSYINSTKDLLFKKYPDILPIIEFVLSQNCSKVIKSLRRLAVRGLAMEREASVFNFNYTNCSASPLSMYNLFWNCKEKLCDLLPEDKGSKDGTEGTLREHHNRLDQLNPFFEGPLVQSGNLLSKIEEENYLARTDTIFKDREYSTLAALLDGNIGVQKAGIIYNVISLQMQATMANHRSKVDSLLDRENNSFRNLPVNEVDNQEAEFNLRQVSEIISKVQPDQKWSYKNIMKRVKDNFDESLMEPPDFEQGAEKTAIHLQERIRRIVLKMIQRQYGSLKEEHFTYYPECQFVQLILPCFVASFLDLDKDPSVSQDTKRLYLIFVKELVKSYETTEFPNKILNLKEAVAFACVINHGLASHYWERKWKFVEEDLSFILSKSKIYDDFISKGVSSNFVSVTLGDNTDFFLNEPFWSNLVFMFNSRVRSALKKIEITEDPTLNFYETLYLTQPSCDMEKVSKDHKWILETRRWVYVAKLPGVAEEEMGKILSDGAPLQMIKDALAIPESNLDGLVLYLSIKYFAEDKILYFNKIYNQGPGFPLDPLVSAIWSLYTKDLWKFKLQITKIFAVREKNEDPTLIPFDVAKSNFCYQAILKFISPEGKVDMNRPGEITFFPVKHCRWCGRVKVKEFRVCPVCAETPDYPDLNLFCSEQCEKEALEKQHEEEHMNFLMEQCGIDK